MVADSNLNTEQVRRQIEYWLDLAEYDIETAMVMLTSRRLLYVAFMCHQTIEKALKGAYVSHTHVLAPKVHALVALAQKAGCYGEMTIAQQDFLEELDPMNIESRYPSDRQKMLVALTIQGCERMIKSTEELFQWIKQRLLN